MIHITSELSFIAKSCSETNPIDRRRNGGAKPRNIELKRERMPFPENNGRTIEEPAMTEDGHKPSYTNKHIMQTGLRIYRQLAS